MQLRELKIIVTGGAQGMGAHFATRLHEAGAKVAVGDLNEKALDAFIEKIPVGRIGKPEDIWVLGSLKTG